MFFVNWQPARAVANLFGDKKYHISRVRLINTASYAKIAVNYN